MIDAVYAALYSQLAAGTAFCAMIGGTATPHIYNQVASEGVSGDYVIFSFVGGGFVPDTPHIRGEGVIRLRAYSKTRASRANLIAEAAFALLDRKPLTVTGWANPWLAAEAPHIELAEPLENGKFIWSSGDDYRLHIDKS